MAYDGLLVHPAAHCAVRVTASGRCPHNACAVTAVEKPKDEVTIRSDDVAEVLQVQQPAFFCRWPASLGWRVSARIRARVRACAPVTPQDDALSKPL